MRCNVNNIIRTVFEENSLQYILFQPGTLGCKFKIITVTFLTGLVQMLLKKTVDAKKNIGSREFHEVWEKS